MDYLDRPVFDFRPDFRAITHGQVDDHTFDPEGSGAATPWKPTSLPRRKIKLPFLTSRGSTASEIPDLEDVRNFVVDRAGRRKGFWLPLWLSDYEPLDDIVEVVTCIGTGDNGDLIEGTYNGVAMVNGDRILLFGTGTGLDGLYDIGNFARPADVDGINNPLPEWVLVTSGDMAGQLFHGSIDGDSAEYLPVDPSIRVRDVGLPFGAGFEQFSHLYIATHDRLELHSITDVATADGVHTITLGENLSAGIDADNDAIGGLLYVRLVRDELAWDFKGDYVARINLEFVELPSEYETASDGEYRIQLFQFTRGVAVWLQANNGTAVTIGDDLFSPSNITASGLRFGIDFLSDETEVRVATDDPTHPLRFHSNAGALGVTNIAIYEIDADDPPAVLPTADHTGRIGSVSFSAQGRITAKVSSSFRISEAQTPRATISRRCMHHLGDDFCQKDLTDFTTVGVITALGNSYVEADEFGDEATAQADPNWFVFGLVTVGIETRMCTGASGNRLYLNAPFQLAIVGNDITGIAGCDKLISTCDAKFDNVEHAVSFFYIPRQNPQFDGAKTPLATGGKK